MKIKFFGKKAFQVISVGMGIICSAVFLYDRFLKNNDADLVYDVLTNTEIFTYNKDIDSLKISYGNEGPIAPNKSIYLITVDIKNQGGADIRSEDIYKDYFGLKIENGKILGSPTLINFSNPVFKEHLNIQTRDSSEIKINAIPINAGEGFTIKLFTLGNKDENPKITPLGYISGLGKLEIQKSYSQNDSKSFLDSKGFKIFTIVIGSLFLLYLIIGFYFIMKQNIISLKRASKVNAYLSQRKKKLTDHAKWLHLLYATDPNFNVLGIRKIWDNKELTMDIVYFIYDFKIDIKKSLSSTYKELRDNKNEIDLGSDFNFFEKLIKNNIIKKRGNEVGFDTVFFDELEDFTNFLKNKKES